MKVVSNSSVLIALSSIGQLDLLRARFPEGIDIPEAVWREVVETGGGRAGAEDISKAVWIARVPVRDMTFVALLRSELDEGEAEALALAHEENSTMVLVDEKDARRVASRLNIMPLGTVGILIWARKKGLIADLRLWLDRLITQGGFRVSQAVYDEALKIVGEFDA